jgi:putative transposase
VYYIPATIKPINPGFDEYIRSRLDYWNTEMCCIGTKKLRSKLMVDDHIENISLEHVRELMTEMGLYAVYPQKNTSSGDKNVIKLPYLLKHMEIWLPNMVWSIDITYIKRGRRHMYLTAIIDWFSRFLLNWGLSDTLEATPVIACVACAFERHGLPAILNSDQGGQFTSHEYKELLADYRVRQSMDGKARWVDNRRTERWFRSLKVENIYITEYDTPRQLRDGVGNYVDSTITKG